MTQPTTTETGFVRGLNLFDATMIVIGTMIGSGIFIVSADMARLINSPGWLLVAWGVTAALTILAALSYGELAAMLPHAGGVYIFLREAYSPLWGFLYGWTLFAVIQTGTIAAVAVGFARFLSVLVPSISENSYLIPPIHVSTGYAFSLSTAQLVGVAVIVLLTWTNSRGLEYGKIVQNVFTTAKVSAIAALILAGVFLGSNAEAIHTNFTATFSLGAFDPALGVAAGSVFGLIIAIGVAQSGSLFSADAWHDVTFIAGEVRDPKKHLPTALVIGCTAVVLLYLLTNVIYLLVLPMPAIQHAPSDRVATAVLDRIFPVLRLHADGDRDHDLDVRLRQQPGACRRASILRHGQGPAVLRAGREAEPLPGAGVVFVDPGDLGRGAGAAAHLQHRHRPVR